MRAFLFALLLSLTFGSIALAQVPAPAEPPLEEPAPAAPPPSAPVAADPASAPPPVDPAPAPPPATEPAPPPAPPPAAEPMPQYDGQVDAQGRAHYTGEPPEEDYGYEDASYPPAEPDEEGGDDDFEIPPFSIRIDPFNWLIEGRLGLELEVGVLDFMTVELVPILIANSEPPTFNFAGREDPLSQESNGLGPIAGASLGVGFWLSGRPLEGYVLRVALTNVGITYKASDSLGVFDEVTQTERRLVFLLGSHSRFGVFTIAGGIGLGYELNQQERCFESGSSGRPVATRSGCPDGELQIAADDPTLLSSASQLEVYDLNGFIHPVYFEGRFSIGVSFD